jgi:hypothetical protein
LIEKYQKSFLRSYGIHWKELSRNPNLTWQEENLLDQFKEKWNWDLLSVNNGVGFTEEQIEKYKFLFTWDSGTWSNQNIASNTNLPWSVGFINKYKYKWHWWSLSRNPGVNWTEEMISTFEENIIWQSMAHNLNLPWSIEFILKHEDVLFKSWSSTNRDFDQHIWKKVFEPKKTVLSKPTTNEFFRCPSLHSGESLNSEPSLEEGEKGTFGKCMIKINSTCTLPHYLF